MRSSASTTCTSAPPTVRASSMFCASRISATSCNGCAPRSGPSVTARMVLITCASGSSPSGARTMIDFAAPGLMIDRSLRSHGSPLRQITSTPFSFGAFLAISSSISTLSRSARIAIRAVFPSVFASESSDRMSTIDGDQLRITVWPVSSTRERPLRSSAIFASSPLESTPIKAENTKMPAMVTTSITMRYGQPLSSPTVPLSSVRISDSQPVSMKSCGRCSPSGAMPTITMNRLAATMIASDTAASHPISATVPADMLLSNRYFARSVKLGW